jgi:uncharacterized protein (TIGR00369 family)
LRRLFSNRQLGLGAPLNMQHLSGLEILREMQMGTRPYPPFSTLLNMRFTQLEKGVATVTAHPEVQHLNIVGSLHGGYIVALLDTAMGSACQTLLGAQQAYVTMELKTSFLRGAGCDAEVSAVAKVVKPGSRAMFAEAELRSSDGKLLATATCTCLVLAD